MMVVCGFVMCEVDLLYGCIILLMLIDVGVVMLCECEVVLWLVEVCMLGDILVDDVVYV